MVPKYTDGDILRINEILTVTTIDGRTTSVTKGVDSNGNEYSACTVSGNTGAQSGLGTKGATGFSGVPKNYKKPHHTKKRKGYER